MLKHLRRLTIVFALLGDSPYAVANIHNLRVLLYHAKERRLPFHKMLVNDVGLFSEEAGEISFSCLGRSVQGVHVADKLKFVTDAYKSIGIFHEMRGFFDPVTERRTAALERSTISFESDEVKVVAMFFKSKLRELAAGQFSWYSSQKAFKKNHDGERNNKTAGIRIPMDSRSALAALWPKVERLDRDWAGGFAHVFGYEAPDEHPTDSSDDVIESDMDPGATSEADDQRVSDLAQFLSVPPAQMRRWRSVKMRFWTSHRRPPRDDGR